MSSWFVVRLATYLLGQLLLLCTLSTFFGVDSGSLLGKKSTIIWVEVESFVSHQSYTRWKWIKLYENVEMKKGRLEEER